MRLFSRQPSIDDLAAGIAPASMFMFFFIIIRLLISFEVDAAKQCADLKDSFDGLPSNVIWCNINEEERELFSYCLEKENYLDKVLTFVEMSCYTRLFDNDFAILVISILFLCGVWQRQFFHSEPQENGTTPTPRAK